MRRRIWYRRELRVYSCTADRIDALPRPARMRRDHLDDLKCYRPTDSSQMPLDRYLTTAEQRLSAGHHLYTCVENGLLLHYGWLIDRQERGEDADLGQVFFPPPDSAALYDYFTHPAARGRGLYFDALCQALHDARDVAGARQVFIYIYSDNAASTHVAEKIGFKYVGSLVATRRFFVRRRFARSARPDFRVEVLRPGARR